ncbi:MAG: 2,3-bisphosphoglycerate-independent phosphoglycerate mutase, partial [Gammaproteobacteria bacterium]
MSLIPHPLILTVLDGWGHSDTTEYNAIHSAHKPVWDDLLALYPHTLIGCSGLDVGLPDNQMGNSEVGHMHLGAGRLVLQELTLITRAVENGSFVRNENLIAPVDRAVRS